QIGKACAPLCTGQLVLAIDEGLALVDPRWLEIFLNLAYLGLEAFHLLLAPGLAIAQVEAQEISCQLLSAALGGCVPPPTTFVDLALDPVREVEALCQLILQAIG